MSLIVLPTALIHCPCGKRLAPHPTAARRMGCADLLKHVDRCDCGVDTLGQRRREAAPDSSEACCEACHDAVSTIRLRDKRGAWIALCQNCLDDRDALIAERFSADRERVE